MRTLRFPHSFLYIILDLRIECGVVEARIRLRSLHQDRELLGISSVKSSNKPSLNDPEPRIQVLVIEPEIQSSLDDHNSILKSPSSSRALARLGDIEASSSRDFSSFEIVLKIARTELELWVLLASRARAQISKLKPSRARASKNMTSRDFSSFEIVLKIARAELELWVLFASRARAQISKLEPSRARASKNMTSRARA
ncbi:hypothetical protein Hanom_Chr04g00280971 [Helianthus anomalus]